MNFVSLDGNGLIELPKAVGPSLHTLYIRNVLPFDRSIAKQVVTGFTGLCSFTCTSTAEIYPKTLLPYMVSQWRWRLEHLSLAKVDQSLVDAIASYCKNLRHLKLNIGYGVGFLETIHMW